MGSFVTHRAKPSLAFNMAPMIDVVFLLIIFFVLVSTFASAERIPMEIPDPDHSLAENIKLNDRVIINIQLARPRTPQSSPVLYSIGPNPPESVASISQRLMAYRRRVPDVKVIIRADRRVRYSAVQEVMEVVAENGIEMMSIVAHTGDAGGRP